MALSIDRKSGWQDWADVVLAVLLFIAPWILQFAGTPAAAWNAWIGGIVVAALAISALLRFAEWEEWLIALVGLWLVLSPWLLGFAAMAAAMWSTVILGALIVISSAWKAFESHGGGHRAPA